MPLPVAALCFRPRGHAQQSSRTEGASVGLYLCPIVLSGQRAASAAAALSISLTAVGCKPMLGST